MPFSLELIWQLFLLLIPRFVTEDWALERVDCGDPFCNIDHLHPVVPMRQVDSWEVYDAIGVFRVFTWLGFAFIKGPLAVRPWPGRK